MVEGTLFDKLEFIARKVRKNDRPFGGIQLILSGDFLQVPRVASGFVLEAIRSPSLSILPCSCRR